VEKVHPHKWVELDLAVIGLQDFANGFLASLRQLPLGEVAPEHRIEHCYIGWYSMTVRGNGDVHPCCFLMPNKSIPPFGNIRTQSVGEIWNGAMYRLFRREMRAAMMMDGKPPIGHGKFRCTVPSCWKHDECPLAYMMAAPDFYQQAHDRLEWLRRRPAVRLARMAATARRAIRR
jgi:MoaA/NifB/PqqE/SkfB family radical SAM enzyme